MRKIAIGFFLGILLCGGIVLWGWYNYAESWISPGAGETIGNLREGLGELRRLNDEGARLDRIRENGLQNLTDQLGAFRETVLSNYRQYAEDSAGIDDKLRAAENIIRAAIPYDYHAGRELEKLGFTIPEGSDPNRSGELGGWYPGRDID